MHVRAIVCTVLYDGRALTTVARLHRMNIKYIYKRYLKRGGSSLSAFLSPFALRPIGRVYLRGPCNRPRGLHGRLAGARNRE